MPADPTSHRLTFPGPTGTRLEARLTRPAGPPLATALFAHCLPEGKDLPAARRITARLAAMGLAVLRFEGSSEGGSEATLAPTAADIRAAAGHLTDLGLPPSLLIGHCLGGSAVLRAAPTLPGIRAVVTLAAPFRDAPAPGPAYLFLHPAQDRTVPAAHALKLFNAAPEPKSLITLDEADHLLSEPQSADEAAALIAAWAGRKLGLTPPAPPIGAPEGVTRVSEADPEGFLQDIQNGPWHHALADEPETYGGTGRGMSPYGFLAAGLGACTAMTIRMYARRKDWPLEHVSVDVTHDKLHAQDAETSLDSRIDRFTRRITLQGPLSEEQRRRLLDIADRCPVHRTLEAGAEIRTELT